MRFFLIAFALYASERNKAHPILIQKESIEPRASDEIALPPEIAEVYQKLRIAPVFTQAVDGVVLLKEDRDLKIEIKSDELYRPGETAVESTWLPVLDQIGNAIFKEGPLQATVVFSSNATDEKDAFSFSSARAEWVLHYLSRKHQFKLDAGEYRVLGLGKTSDSQGKSIPTLEIVIQPKG